jgi:Flp pilus assembly protein TadG
MGNQNQMQLKLIFSKLNDQQGVSAVLIAVCLFMLMAFVALAIDVSHLVVARNELQNAADAGALAGAGDLYTDDGTSVNTNANQIGYDAATANISEQVSVEVNWSGGNTGDVQRGHWSFATRTFTPNASTAPVDLWGVTLCG